MQNNLVCLSNKKWKIEFFQILLIAVVSSLFFFITYRVWEYDLRIPFPYTSGDGMFFSGVVKGIADHGWYTENPFLAAPFGRELYDFPIFSEMSNMLQIRMLSFFFDDYAHIINFLAFSIFPATAVTSFFVLRRLSCSYVCSWGGAMCYTFLTYRVHRLNIGHFFLSDYAFIPLIVLVFFWLIEDERFFRPQKDFCRYFKNWFGFVFLIIFSMRGIYYTFFSCFFIVVILLGKKINKKKIRDLIPCFLALLCLILPLILAYIPTFIYIKNNGVNPQAPDRNPYETQTLSLELAGILIAPQRNHYFFLEETVERFRPITLSAGNGYLGILGILGFFILVFSSFMKKKSVLSGKIRNFRERIYWLHQLLIFGLLLSTVGGGGVLFSVFINSQIRAYNRMSIFIAFFCIAGFCLLCEMFFRSLQPKRWLLQTVRVIVIAIFTIGLLEQAYFRPTGSYEEMKMEFQSDANFVKMIEGILGENAMVLQLPYQPFPEIAPIENMQDYSHTRGYLHSDTLRWSYGAYKGRPTDQYLREMTEKSMEDMLLQAQEIGFTGIYVDTFGYTPEALEILETEISNCLDTEKAVSENERLWFYLLKGKRKSLPKICTTT